VADVEHRSAFVPGPEPLNGSQRTMAPIYEGAHDLACNVSAAACISPPGPLPTRRRRV